MLSVSCFGVCMKGDVWIALGLVSGYRLARVRPTLSFALLTCDAFVSHIPSCHPHTLTLFILSQSLLLQSNHYL